MLLCLFQLLPAFRSFMLGLGGGKEGEPEVKNRWISAPNCQCATHPNNQLICVYVPQQTDNIST